jgi:hypothetical protein
MFLTALEVKCSTTSPDAFLRFLGVTGMLEFVPEAFLARGLALAGVASGSSTSTSSSVSKWSESSSRPQLLSSVFAGYWSWPSAAGVSLI